MNRGVGTRHSVGDSRAERAVFLSLPAFNAIDCFPCLAADGSIGVIEEIPQGGERLFGGGTEPAESFDGRVTDFALLIAECLLEEGYELLGCGLNTAQGGDGAGSDGGVGILQYSLQRGGHGLRWSADLADGFSRGLAHQRRGVAQLFFEIWEQRFEIGINSDEGGEGAGPHFRLGVAEAFPERLGG